MEDIKGRKIIAFEFKGGPGMTDAMIRQAKKRSIGVIEEFNGINCIVNFPEIGRWTYPYPEILQHMLPEEEIDLNKLFKDIIKIIKIVK